MKILKLGRYLKVIKLVHMDRLCVIINPYSQGGRTGIKTNHYLKKLKDNNFKFDSFFTNSKNHSSILIEQLLNEYNTFLGIGGDGLVHEMIQILKDKKNKALSIAPAGNGNMFARHHNINSFDDAVCALKEDNRISIDLVKITYVSDNEKKKTIYSHCIFGLGYIESVIAHASKTFRKIGKPFCYPLSSFAASLKMDDFDSEITIDNKKLQFKNTNSIMCLNHGKVGPFNLAEDVDDRDGFFNYVIYHNTGTFESWFEILDTILAFYRFEKRRLSGKAKKLQIKLDSPKNLMVDGELLENIVSMNAEIMPKALNTYSIKKSS